MASLAGLVNYSDDEDSSSSGDEAQVSQTTTIGTKKPVKIVDTPPVAAPARHDLPQTRPVPSSVKTPLPSRQGGGSMNEYNRRLLAALAPKPVEGVENWGIPGEPDTRCDLERAERIAHYLSLKASGHRLNDHLQRNKAFRNPRIYAKLVEFAEVDEIGSNFDKKDFDPHGFPKEMYIDGILETQKKLAEEKAAQQQNRTSVNFVPQQQELSQQQSTVMAQAMATAAKVASRIAKLPTIDTGVGDKRKNKRDDDHPNKR